MTTDDIQIQTNGKYHVPVNWLHYTITVLLALLTMTAGWVARGRVSAMEGQHLVDRVDKLEADVSEIKAAQSGLLTRSEHQEFVRTVETGLRDNNQLLQGIEARQQVVLRALTEHDNRFKDLPTR